MNKSSLVLFCLVALFVLAFAYQYEYFNDDESSFHNVLSEDDIEDVLNADHQTLFDDNQENDEEHALNMRLCDIEDIGYNHTLCLPFDPAPAEEEFEGEILDWWEWVEEGL